MGNFFKKAFNPAKNNAWTRAQKGISTGKKAVVGEDSSDDAARSEAATNQDPNKNRSRQGGSAQIDYYGTETGTT